MNKKIIPKDSCICRWLEAMAITEVPISYQVVTGLAIIGAVLKRNVYINQELWRVHPNLSLLMIGPSGIGKDTVIDQAVEMLERIGTPEIVSGRTIEMVYEQMLQIGDPACCVIPAREVSVFFGQKDYQKGMVQELTDLLSTGGSVDVSIKETGKRKILRPTVTMLAGSTLEWLHRAMPDGSLEGGLWPRFLIVNEAYGSRYVPLIKHSLSKHERDAAVGGLRKFEILVERIRKKYSVAPREIMILKAAQDLYTNWYINRLDYFSPMVRPYANRSRDQVLRVAMISAISRGLPYVEEADMQVGIDVLGEVARTLDSAVQPASQESRICDDVLKMLPEVPKKIMVALGRKYSLRYIKEAMAFLVETDQIKQQSGKWYTKGD
jgi:hypothetical protein